MKPHVSLTYLLVILALAACAPSTPAPAGIATSRSPAPLALQPCKLPGDVAAQCGTLTVYENRSARSGRQIGVRVAVVEATGTAREADPVFWLAGGPGAAATGDASWLVPQLARVNERRDLVFVDQRGTGMSHEMICSSTAGLARPGAAGEATLVADLQACLAGLDGDPRAYTTAWAMDDLDDVRQALGYDTINLFGGSYGSAAAQVYLRRHGEHVRTAALGGVTLLDIPILERTPRSSQAALDALFARCEADASCHLALPGVRAEFAAIAAQLDRGPVSVSDPRSGTAITITRDVFSGITHYALYNTGTAVLLPRLIHAAALGDWGLLALAYAEAGGSGNGINHMSVMNLTILCHEPWAVLRRAETEQLSAGSYAGYEQVRLMTVSEAACAVMPEPEPGALYGPATRSGVPVLLLNGGSDPQNPPENVAGARDLWPNSLALVEPGQGHNLNDWRCHFALVTALIEAGTSAGLDTRCLQEIRLPPFDAGASGTAGQSDQAGFAITDFAAARARQTAATSTRFSAVRK